MGCVLLSPSVLCTEIHTTHTHSGTLPPRSHHPASPAPASTTPHLAPAPHHLRLGLHPVPSSRLPWVPSRIRSCQARASFPSGSCSSPCKYPSTSTHYGSTHELDDMALVWSILDRPSSRLDLFSSPAGCSAPASSPCVSPTTVVVDSCPFLFFTLASSSPPSTDSA